MLYLTSTTLSSIDLAYYRVSRAKDLVSVVQDFSEIESIVCAPIRKDNTRALVLSIYRLIDIIFFSRIFFTCTMIYIVDLAHYRLSRAKYLVSVDCDAK